VYIFGELTSNDFEVYAVKTHNFCRDLATIRRQFSFVSLAFGNGLKDHNFDFRRVTVDHFCPSCRNLVKF